MPVLERNMVETRAGRFVVMAEVLLNVQPVVGDRYNVRTPCEIEYSVLLGRILTESVKPLGRIVGAVGWMWNDGMVVDICRQDFLKLRRLAA